MKILLSTLPKMWILDIDGVIFVHNSHLQKDKDKLVPNFLDFYNQISPDDFILIVSARDQKYKTETIKSLRKYKIRYDKIIFNVPKGERILINDTKPEGLQTAVAINTKRDQFEKMTIIYDNR